MALFVPNKYATRVPDSDPDYGLSLELDFMCTLWPKGLDINEEKLARKGEVRLSFGRSGV